MSIEDFLHPLWKRSLELDKNNLNTTMLHEIQKPLSQAEQDIIASRIQLSVDTATSYWLDYWGSWLGLHRINGWTDDEYREHLKHHVLHPRNTIPALQQAVADFLNTDKANIHIYEPFRDMLIWNKSNYNSFAYFPSTYYRYAVIDVQIDAPYDKTVAEIINLFRPAGVIWVITSKINSFSDEAPIIPMGIRNARYPFLSYDTNYAGFESRDTGRIVPSLDNTLTVDDPFVYNDNESLLNEGKKYAGGNSSHNNVASVGQLVRSYTPLETDEFSDTRAYVEQLTHQDRVAVSTRDGNAKTFTLSPAKLNLVQGTTGDGINYNLLTGTSEPFLMGYGIPNTTWDTTNQVSGISLPVTAKYAEVLPQGAGFHYMWMPGVTYTQSIYISTDAPLTGTPISFTWFANNQGHDTRGSDNLLKVSTNVYRATSTYTWPSSNSPADNSRNADLYNLTQVFDFTKGTFLQFYKPKLEKGSVATDWCPAESEITDPEYSRKKTLMGGAPNTIPDVVGTNLLTNTSDFSSNWSGMSSISTTTEYNGYPSMVFTSSNLQLASQTLDLGKLENSSQYTISFWAKANNAGDKAHTELWGSIGVTNFVLTTNWVRYTAVVTSYSDASTNISHSSCYFGVPAGNKGNVYIAEPKLEKGSVATDWTPNIKDSLVNSLAYKGYLLDASLKTNTTYDIGLTGYSSTTFAQSNVKLYINGNTPISAVLKSSLDNKSTWYTASFTTPEDFVSDRIIAISLEGIDNAPDFTYSNLVIREHDNTKPLYYSMNKNDTQKDYGLTGIYDVKGFINTYKTPLDSNATNQTINDMFASKNMMFTVKSLATTNDVNVKIQMYNFKINMWVTQDTQTVTKDYKDIMLTINDITPYLNDNGVLFYQVIPETKNYLVVNYLGLSVTKRSDTPDTSYLVNQDGCGGEQQ